MKSKDRCQGCPASRGQPCHNAQERIRAMQIASTKKENPLLVASGCEWYINSAEYNYCFHNMLKDLDGLPMSDKDICKLLMISQSELKEIYTSAINKLKSSENEEAIQGLLDIVTERTADVDNSLYMPIEFGAEIARSQHEISEDSEGAHEENKKGKRGPKPKKKQPLHGLGLPLHHSGKRVDIHFGYSPARYNEIQENKKKIRKSKKDEENK